MKSVKTFLAEMDKEPLDKKTYTPEQIAKKHGCSVEEIEKAVEAGIKVEREHTSHEGVAREIALDHLNERPDYYARLKKVEGINESSEGMSVHFEHIPPYRTVGHKFRAYVNKGGKLHDVGEHFDSHSVHKWLKRKGYPTKGFAASASEYEKKRNQPKDPKEFGSFAGNTVTQRF